MDKIQEVPQAMILPMLEAVRLSLEELGYRLGLPVDAGDNNGLSDTDAILEYIDSEVNPLFTNRLTKFKPHWNRYKFDKGYSRAYSKPELLEFERQEGNFKIEAGEIYRGSKIPEELKVEDLYQEVLSLKDSNKEEDQIQFINQLKSLTEIEELNLPEDFAEDYLKSKIQERQESFKVRKKALYTLINWGEVDGQEALDWVANHFSENEQTAFVGEISNWLDSEEDYKQNFIYSFVYKFLSAHIGQNVQFSFQSIVFNILNDLDVKMNLISLAIPDRMVSSIAEKIINYLIESITLEQVKSLNSADTNSIAPYFAQKLNQEEVQSLEGEILEIFWPHLTEEQKSWVTLKQFLTITVNPYQYFQVAREIAVYTAPRLNQTEVQSLEGGNLEIFLSYLTEEQKVWVTFKQFLTIPHQSIREEEEIVVYTAQRLNQEEVQSLEGENLDIFWPHLTEEQKVWVTLEQFQTLPYYAIRAEKEIAVYVASRLNRAEVQSLRRQNVDTIFLHLTEEQKSWVTTEQFLEALEALFYVENSKEIAVYVVPRLGQTEVESLERRGLKILLPHLTSEQINWVTLEKFQRLISSVDEETRNLAESIALKLNQEKVQSLEGEILEIFWPHLTEEQKDWVTIEQFLKVLYYHDNFEEMALYITSKLNRAEVQSLDEIDLEILMPHLTEEQKAWVTLAQFLTISNETLSEAVRIIAPYLAQKLNQEEVQSLEGRVLSNIVKHLTGEQKAWVTFEQFLTIPHQAVRAKEKIAVYLAQKLNQEEVQSVEGSFLSSIVMHLTEEQKDWVTFEQFLTISDLAVQAKEEIAVYLALRLNQAEVQSLRRQNVDIFWPHLTEEQKSWLTTKQFLEALFYAENSKEIAVYTAPRLGQTEVKSLERRVLKILLPHLTSEQINWVTLERFQRLISSEETRSLAESIALKLNQEKVQSLEGKLLRRLIPHLSDEQKEWIDIEKFNALDLSEKRKLIPYLNQRLFQLIPIYISRERAGYLNKSIVQSLTGEDLDRLLPNLKDEQKNWITLEQFKTLPPLAKEYDPVVRDFIRKMAPRLNQAEVQSLAGKDLELLLPHLTSEQKEWVDIEKFNALDSYTKVKIIPYLNQRLFQQLTGEEVYEGHRFNSNITEIHKNWITLRQFQTMLFYSSGSFKEEIAPYLAPRLNQTEVESLERRNLEILLPYLTSEQKEWIRREGKAGIIYRNILQRF